MTEKKTLLDVAYEAADNKKILDNPTIALLGMIEAICEETERRLAALKSTRDRTSQVETKAWTLRDDNYDNARWCEAMARFLANKDKEDFNPKLTGSPDFWFWDRCSSKAIYGLTINYMSHHKDFDFFISIGNAFQTREEAEDEGKWQFETKLILDEKLRECRKKFGIKNAYLIWVYGDECIGCHEGKDASVNICGWFVESRSILGDNAKRYLTGEQ